MAACITEGSMAGSMGGGGAAAGGGLGASMGLLIGFSYFLRWKQVVDCEHVLVWL